MRFLRIPGLLTAAALLMAASAGFGQSAYSPSAAPAPVTGGTTAPTLTPPGSSTSVPLLPDNPATTPGGTAPGGMMGGGLTGSGSLSAPALPSGGLSMLGMYPGLGGMGTGSDLTTILTGSSDTPLTLTLGQLDSHWRRLTVGGNLDFGSLSQVFSSFLGSAGVGVYYTKGATVSVGDATYLVAYRAYLSAHDLAAMSGTMSGMTPPSPPKLSAQTPLALSLLNLQTAGSLTDIRPFSLTQEIADSASAAHAMSNMATSLGTAAMGAMMARPGAAHTGNTGATPQP